MFTLKHYILEIAKTGSFSQAADHLYVSQPSLSAVVKRLERRIGEDLFDRGTHPVRLTECGKEYVRCARAIEEVENNFQAYLDEHRKSQSGRLVLGGSNLNLSFVLPPLLKKFRERYPLVEISLVESDIDELQKLLFEGEVDLIIDSGAMDPTRFEEYPFQSERLLLAVPRAFACNDEAKAYQISYEDVLGDAHADPALPRPPLSFLKNAPFLSMTPETDTGKREKNLFRHESFRPTVLFSFRQQSTAFHMACRGIGCAVISDVLVKNSASEPDLCFYKLDEKESFRHIKCYLKKGRRLSFAQRAFLELAGIQI